MSTIELSPGKTMYYDERGRGAVLVLLHGFPLDGRVWDDQLAGLSDRFRVIVPDLAGFGRSHCDQPFSIASLAGDIRALLQRLAVKPPYALGGLSMGGYVSLAFATQYAADLSHLILVDTRAAADNPEGREKRNKMIETVRVGGSAAVAAQMLPNMTTPVHGQDARLVRKLREIMESCPAKTIEHACIAMRDRADYIGGPAGIRVPTLIIVGEHDAITPVAMSQTMCDAIPRSRLVVIPNAGHMTPMEAPADVNRAVSEFLG